MLLSSDAVEQLVAASQVRYGESDDSRRAASRAAVESGARELGIDPLAPPLPRFADGETVLSAGALRVLKLPLEKKLEQERQRADACKAAADRIAELERRRDELSKAERARMLKSIQGGQAPGAAPPKAVAELQAILGELALVDEESAQVRGWVYANERGVILEAVSTPETMPSLVLYGALCVQRLRALTANERYDSSTSRATQLASAEVRGFVKDLQYLRGRNEELYGIARGIERAVEIADLHRLQQRAELTLEQLDEAARSRPAAAVR